MPIPSSTQELRTFLQQCVDEIKPLTYTDRNSIQHKVYLTQLRESKARVVKGQDETVLALTMIEASPETLEGGATGARAQEQFLLQCVDEVKPLTFIDANGNKHRAFITRIEKQNRRTKVSSTKEWAYALTMIDAWSGVWITEMPGINIAVAKTVTIQTHVAAKYGTAKYGLAQYGT